MWKSGAVASLPDKKLLVGYGGFEWNEQPKSGIPNFYFPDFFLINTRPWLHFEHYQYFTINEFLHPLNQADSGSQIFWEMTHQELFYHQFDQLQQQFTTSQLQKAVPYAFSYAKQSMPLETSLKRALKTISNYPCYLYGFWNQEEGMLGVTPEILLSRSGPDIQTMALAGTCRKGRTFTSKDEREHQLVVEGIKEALGCYGTISIGKMETLELPTLHHLHTPITIQLNHEVEWTDLVRALHPTPALGAFPKANGAKWLADYAVQIPRGRYGAPAGVVHDQIAHFVVAIRNVQWNQDGLRIGAGCGVIKESNCDQEWQEIQLKLHAIQESLAL